MSQPCLPWPAGHPPLMLAPMQGLTNRGLRRVFGEMVRPDVLFTEFVRVRSKAKRAISPSDLHEACATVAEIPLVVQLMGTPDASLVDAARTLVARGVVHINVNMGCPFGRMKSHLSGGGMFRAPETIEPMLSELRAVVPGSLSVKTRSGLLDGREILSLVTAFEAAEVDFLVLHPRTVAQRYLGAADHDITRELVAATRIPVIANGDVCDEAHAGRVLQHTRAAGLMLGRGAMGDPFLFERIRGTRGPRPGGVERKRELTPFLERLLGAYEGLFCGDAQVLMKMFEALAFVRDPELVEWVTGLRRTKKVTDFSLALRA